MLIMLSGFLYALSLCLELGIVNVAILKKGVERGFTASFLVGVGSSVGDLIYAVLSMAGLALLLQKQVWLQYVLWVGGTVVMLYLAYTMVKSALKPKALDFIDTAQGIAIASPFKDFFLGLGLALASPSAILWFAAVGGPIMAASASHERGALMLFFIGFFCCSILWSLGMATISHHGGKRLGSRLVKGFSLASALLFLYFAIKVFSDGISKFL